MLIFNILAGYEDNDTLHMFYSINRNFIYHHQTIELNRLTKAHEMGKTFCLHCEQ